MQLCRGAHHSVNDLEMCRKDYIETYAKNPKPLVWKNASGENLKKVERSRQTLTATYA